MDAVEEILKKPKRQRLTVKNAAAMFESSQHGKVIGLQDAAKLVNKSYHTVKKWIALPEFRDAAKPGKPVLILRDRFMAAAMNRDQLKGSRKRGSK